MRSAVSLGAMPFQTSIHRRVALSGNGKHERAERGLGLLAKTNPKAKGMWLRFRSTIRVTFLKPWYSSGRNNADATSCSRHHDHVRHFNLKSHIFRMLVLPPCQRKARGQSSKTRDWWSGDEEEFRFDFFRHSFSPAFSHPLPPLVFPPLNSKGVW